MFSIYLVHVLADGGLLATVMPHGVLFRGGEEKAIRAGMIQEDLLEAVIGLAPNLFYGTGIPACILVMRKTVNGKSGKPKERRGRVLFINADREYFQERDARYLEFRSQVTTRQSLKCAIEGNPGLLAKERAVGEAFDHWWKAHASRITKLAGQPSFVGVRNDLLRSFSAALDPLALLDAFQVRGIVAGVLGSIEIRFFHPDGAR